MNNEGTYWDPTKLTRKLLSEEGVTKITRWGFSSPFRNRFHFVVSRRIEPSTSAFAVLLCFVSVIDSFSVSYGRTLPSSPELVRPECSELLYSAVGTGGGLIMIYEIIFGGVGED